MSSDQSSALFVRLIKLIYKVFTVIFAPILFFFIFFEFPNYLVILNEHLGLPCWKIEVGKYIAAFLIGLGIMTWSYCWIIFAISGDGTIFPAAPPKRLVVKGIYRYSRNPIYVSIFAILFGIFLLKGHLLLLIYVPLCWIIFHLYIILREEPLLRRRFGDSYTQYCKSVGRWIPRLTPYREDELESQ